MCEYSSSTRKRRCIPASTSDGCRLCQALSIPCTLRRGSSHLNVATSHSKDATHRVQREEDNRLGVFGSRELLLELVPLYFQYVHNIAHTIFHEPSFMKRLQQGKAPLMQVYAMCALAARWVSPHLTRANATNSAPVDTRKIAPLIKSLPALGGRYT